MPNFSSEVPRKMRDEDKTKEQLIEELAEVEEPWLPIETKLVTYSVIGGIAALIVLAIVVHMFILGGH